MGPESTPCFASSCFKSSSVRSVTSTSSARGLSVFLVAFCRNIQDIARVWTLTRFQSTQTHDRSPQWTNATFWINLLFQIDSCWRPRAPAAPRRWRKCQQVDSCCSGWSGASDTAARRLLFYALRWEVAHCLLRAHSLACLSWEPTDLRGILPCWTLLFQPQWDSAFCSSG